MQMNECLDLVDARDEELNLGRFERAGRLGAVVSRDHKHGRVPDKTKYEHCRADRKHDFNDDTPMDRGESHLMVNRML